VPLGFGWHYTTPEQFQKCKELLAMAGIDRRMVPTAPDDVMALRALKATKTEPKPV
jgi:hypothetical protein